MRLGWNKLQGFLLPSLLLRRHHDWLRGLPRWGSAVSGQFYQLLIFDISSWLSGFSCNRFLSHNFSDPCLHFSSPSKPQFKCHRHHHLPHYAGVRLRRLCWRTMLDCDGDQPCYWDNFNYDYDYNNHDNYDDDQPCYWDNNDGVGWGLWYELCF